MPKVPKHPALAQVVEGPPSNTNNIIVSTVDTPNGHTTDQLKQKTINMGIKVMRCKERNIFLGVLIRLGLGTKEVEVFSEAGKVEKRG